MALEDKTPPDALNNGDFKQGLNHWAHTGGVHLAKEKGAQIVQLGPGKGEVSQRYEVGGMRVLLCTANLKISSPKTDPQLLLRCFDSHGRVLTDLSAGVDAQKTFKDGAAAPGIYLKTHPFTTHIVITVSKGNEGVVTLFSVKLQDDDRNRKEHAPQIDLDEYMRPIWEAETITNESVLLHPDTKGTLSGKLLYEPEQILSVKDPSLRHSYQEGKDFERNGKTLFAVSGSPIPKMKEGDLAKGEYPWTDLTGHHIFVTYRHKDRPAFPIPSFQGHALPLTMKRLKDHQPLTVVAYGDSITLGINVSGYRNVPPYMPPWPALVERQLGKEFANPKVKVYNMGLGGMTSQWAKDNAKDAVASLNPDLVLIAFGMNDFWSLTPDLFKANIQATMAEIRKKNPYTEFILIASLKFDPAYTSDPTYVGNLAGYAGALKSLTGPGVALFDMTSLSQALYDAKSAKDLEADPMHPDDFLARFYAQGIIAIFKNREGEPGK